ncbi:hypothetical protein OK016_01755 [Vibrio chagasii]|nr:hypothetical protein [Vibrio chagasii]
MANINRSIAQFGVAKGKQRLLVVAALLSYVLFKYPSVPFIDDLASSLPFMLLLFGNKVSLLLILVLVLVSSFSLDGAWYEGLSSQINH